MNSSLKNNVSSLLSKEKNDLSFLQRKQKKIKKDLLYTKKFNQILDGKIEDTWNWIYFDRKRPIDKSVSFKQQKQMVKMLDALEKQKRDSQYSKTYIQMNQDFSSIREKICNANKTLADHNISWGENQIRK